MKVMIDNIDYIFIVISSIVEVVKTNIQTIIYH